MYCRCGAFELRALNSPVPCGGTVLGVVAFRDVEAEQLAATGSAMSMFGSVAQDFTADDMYVIASSLNTELEREGAAERISCVRVMETGPGTISVEMSVGSAAIAQTTLTVLTDRVGGSGAPITATLGAPFTSRPYQASSFEPDSSLSELSSPDALTGETGAAASSGYIIVAVIILVVVLLCINRYINSNNNSSNNNTKRNTVSPAGSPADFGGNPAYLGYHGDAAGRASNYGNSRLEIQCFPSATYPSP